MKIPRRMDSDSSNQYEDDNHDTDKSPDSQSNNKANLDQMEDLNIG